MLLTDITARPASWAVEISTRPPATLCRSVVAAWAFVALLAGAVRLALSDA